MKRIIHVNTGYGGRISKFNKMYAIISEFKDIRKEKILDIGIGSGIITNEFAKISDNVYGVDVIDYTTVKKRFKFNITKGTILPFKDNYFDIVISNHAIEHMVDPRGHIKEVRRVLKKDGVCYLATPNKYWLFEKHFKLPFLSYFPKYLSSFYLRIVKGEKYDINLLSLRTLKKILSRWKITNMTIEIMRYPKKYCAEDIKFKELNLIFEMMPKKMLELCCYFAPSWIFILQKRNK